MLNTVVIVEYQGTQLPYNHHLFLILYILILMMKVSEWIFVWKHSFVFLFCFLSGLNKLNLCRMLKSNLHLFQELNKLWDQGCCLYASINGHDGTVSVHLPLLVAANPWIGNCIDDKDSVHVILLPDYSVMELESFVEKLYCCLQDADPVPTPFFSVPSTPTEVFHTPSKTPNHHHHQRGEHCVYLVNIIFS